MLRRISFYRVGFVGSAAMGALSLLIAAFSLAPALAQPTGGVVKDDEEKASLTRPISLQELEKKLGGRTMLSLKLQDATLEEVAAAMSESSGLNIRVQPVPGVSANPAGAPVDGARGNQPPPPAPFVTHYTFEAKQQPFWEALFAWKSAARAADLIAVKAAAKPPVLSPNGQPIPLFLQHAPMVGLEPRKVQKSYWLSPYGNLPNGRLAAAWPLVILVTNIQRAQDGQFESDPFQLLYAASMSPPATPIASNKAADKDQTTAANEDAMKWSDQMNLNLNVFFDPKIKPQGVICELQEAVDDRGNDLLPPRERSGAVISDHSYSQIDAATLVRTSLQPRPAMGKRLKKLRGTLRFVLPLRHEKWEITDLNTPKQRNVWQDGALFQISFGGLEKTDAGWQAKFSIYGEGNRIKQIPGGGTFSGGSGGLSSSFSNSTDAGGQTDFGLDALSFVDEGGRALRISGVSGNSGFEGETRTAQPKLSPPTPGMERWTYREEKTVQFSPEPDASGNVQTSQQGNDAANGEANTRTGKLPRIVINIPVEKREVTVPFEFNDLPLPPS